LVQSELWQQFAVKRQGILTTLGKRVQACRALGDLPDPLRDQYRALAERLEQERTLEQFLQGPASCAEELVEAEKLRRRTGEIMRRHLSEAENKVLGRIIELSGQLPVGSEMHLDRLKG